LAERAKEPEEAIDAVAFDPATHQSGYLRLVEPEQFRQSRNGATKVVAAAEKPK
jgi:hypothetical protein